MLSIEKDSHAEEICIHGTPEDLREFAKKLWAIAEKGESRGVHQEQFSTSFSSDPELSTTLQGDSDEFSIVTRLTVCSYGK